MARLYTTKRALREIRELFAEQGPRCRSYLQVIADGKRSWNAAGMLVDAKVLRNYSKELLARLDADAAEGKKHG